MSQVYFDPDAIRIAQAKLRLLHSTMESQSQQHTTWSWDVETALRSLAQQLDPSRWFDVFIPWDQSGLGGIAQGTNVSRSIVQDAYNQIETTVEHVCIAHGVYVGGTIRGHADSMYDAFHKALSMHSDLVSEFSPSNLLQYLVPPWSIAAIFRDVSNVIYRATVELDEFGMYLGRLLEHEEAAILDIVFDISQRSPHMPTASTTVNSNDKNSNREDRVRFQTMRDLYRKYFAKYESINDGTTPIIISETTDAKGHTMILVALQGVNLSPSNWGQANNIGLAVGVGTQYPGSRHAADTYESEIQSDIAKYLAERGLSPNTPIMIAGHSLGGMEAQELVADRSQNHFNIVDVETFGSPDLGLGWNGVAHNMYAAPGDWVPKLSAYEFQTHGESVDLSPDSHILEPYTGEKMIDGGSWDPLAAHGSYAESNDLRKVPINLVVQYTEYFSAPR